MADSFYLSGLKTLGPDVILAIRIRFAGGKPGTAESMIRNRNHRMDSLEDCRKFLQWVTEEIGRNESVTKMVPTRHRTRLSQ